MEISPAVFHVKNLTLENSATARKWKLQFNWFNNLIYTILVMLRKKLSEVRRKFGDHVLI